MGSLAGEIRVRWLLTGPCLFVFARSDKTLQDIVYKLVPGLFKGIYTPFLLPATRHFPICCSLSTLLPSFFQMR